MEEVHDSNFEAKVLQSKQPVLVDFRADWCQPCKPVMKILEKLETEFEGRVCFMHLDVGKNPKTARERKIRSLPTVLAFRNGEQKGQLAGAHPENQFRVLANVALE